MHVFGNFLILNNHFFFHNITDQVILVETIWTSIRAMLGSNFGSDIQFSFTEVFPGSPSK
jgi:hypothetical protein